MKRCFVAMAISEETRSALANLQAELKKLPASAARRLRPVPSQNLHLTVKFLGNTPDAQIDEVAAALREVAANAPPPGALVGGTGAFPSLVRPRVVFAGLSQGGEAVAALCSAVAHTLVHLGFPLEGHGNHPHVTLARIEGALPRGPLTSWLEDHPGDELGPVADDALVLFESHLTPRGAIYERLATLPLAAP